MFVATVRYLYNQYTLQTNDRSNTQDPRGNLYSAQKRLRRRMKLCFSGNLVEIPSVHTGDTVLETTQHIASFLQEDVISLNVIYHGQVLDHSKCLSDYGIQWY